MSEACWVCGAVDPDGGLRMTETDDLICRWVVPCAQRIAEQQWKERGEAASG